jgi:hypothetical protein
MTHCAWSVLHLFKVLDSSKRLLQLSQDCREKGAGLHELIARSLAHSLTFARKGSKSCRTDHRGCREQGAISTPGGNGRAKSSKGLPLTVTVMAIIIATASASVTASR